MFISPVCYIHAGMGHEIILASHKMSDSPYPDVLKRRGITILPQKKQSKRIRMVGTERALELLLETEVQENFRFYSNVMIRKIYRRDRPG